MTGKTMKTGVLIVGAGHAGAQVALMLRKLGYSGAIALVGAEPDYPYERPSLSKGYLAGEDSLESITIRPKEVWDGEKVDVLLGRRIVQVVPDDQQAICGNGETISYDKLIWAAGGSPRQLSVPGGHLSSIHVIRSRADVDALRAETAQAKNIVVIGGGYIGLEASSVLVGFGKRVTILEGQNRLLSRVAGPELSAFYAKEHRNKGVNVRLGTAIEEILGMDGRATGVRIAGGEILLADAIIVGIGIEPEVAPLIEAGAQGALAGVKVDEFCRTTLSNIYAAGDCAAHPNRYADGALTRLESIQNAYDQATVVAKSIVGDPVSYDAVPWFWSEQYDLKLQTAGLLNDYDEVVLRGDPETRSFSVIYLKEDRVIALDCVNDVKSYAHGRRLISKGGECERNVLVDPSLPLVPRAGKPA